MNMKWKLTLRYVLSIAIVAISVVILNIVLLFMLVIYNINETPNEYSGKYEGEYYTREFKKYININQNNEIDISEEGKISLDEKKLWIQILDINSTEVYSYNKPKDIKEKHTPIELINGYKYTSGFGGGCDILVGEKKIKEKSYTYIIGFPYGHLEKYTFIMEQDILLQYIKYAIIAIIITDFIISVIFGYIFSKSLTKPIKRIIAGVDELSSGKYDIFYKEKGIYSNVFRKLNMLSDKLKDNEVERIKIEKMREEFIANISHDIKTPLSSIKGYAEILEGDYDFNNDEISEYANIINSKADYIKELVDDLNLTIKLKDKAFSINKIEINIVNLVKNSIIDIFNDPRYCKRDIEFITSKSKINKNVDEILIKRAINNLIYNALVHNEENTSITVKVFEDKNIHILICDNGKGISQEELNYIFERYYRGTNTGENHKGSGLGMAIAKEIINAHDGYINISSKLGKGTEIEIII